MMNSAFLDEKDLLAASEINTNSRSDLMSPPQVTCTPPLTVTFYGRKPKKRIENEKKKRSKNCMVPIGTYQDYPDQSKKKPPSSLAVSALIFSSQLVGMYVRYGNYWKVVWMGSNVGRVEPDCGDGLRGKLTKR